MRDGPVVLAFLVSSVGLVALLAVFVFWGGTNSSEALPYFAVPGVLFALAALVGYRAVQHRE
ncbi:MAG TPA: hypothetical protein VFU33_04400 [Gaiellaceae bacterium]|nr:hypothetical protein [Gaiellaceae bacterium]